MRKFVLEFLRRGFVACGMGPIILAILSIGTPADTSKVPNVCLLMW